MSLVGASFGPRSRVVGMRHFNRILGFDPEKGTVEAEAGATLGRLFAFLASKRCMIPVLPGYPGITLGGCIAANVHGKNPFRDGVFADIVSEIRLFHPVHGEMRIGPNKSPELFELTCGGFGLTGIIVSATIVVQRMLGTAVEVSLFPTDGLQTAVDTLFADADKYDFLYSWHDLARFDDAIGRGFVVAGRMVDGGGEIMEAPPDHDPIDPRNRGYGVNLFNGHLLPFINRAYYRLNCGRRRRLGLFETLFPFTTMPAYFRAYGAKGFIEHQVLIPREEIESYLSAFTALVRRRRQRFGLASLKRFGGTRSLLRYSGEGVSFALHLPSSQEAGEFLGQLDGINTDHGAISNIIKDARLSANVARAQYPEFETFRRRLLDFDPQRHFASAMSERLGL